MTFEVKVSTLTVIQMLFEIFFRNQTHWVCKHRSALAVQLSQQGNKKLKNEIQNFDFQFLKKNPAKA